MYNKGVYLVGGGPGDPGLMTLKGQALIQACDAIVYDQLANPAFLNETKEGCMKYYAGKIAGNHSMTQDQINDLLATLAMKHEVVVRLKGGDPYVFGRGSEEALFLMERGIYVEVIPGVTSAIGGLAAAGIPVTAREVATSFHVITGHTSQGSSPLDIEALAKLEGTLIFLMGIGNLAHIVTSLMAGGLLESTPVAIIEKASTPWQRTIKGTLSTILKISQEAQACSPALIVVGKVVAFESSLPRRAKGPLSGLKIAVTGSFQKQSPMLQKLARLDANPIRVPLITFDPIGEERLLEAVHNLDRYQGILFTSKIGVILFFEALYKVKKDTRALYGKCLVSIGRETDRALEAYGLRSDLCPESYGHEGLVDTLKSADLQGTYLLPRSIKGDNSWHEALEPNLTIDPIDAYDTKSVLIDEATKDLMVDADYIVFSSASTVHGFFANYPEALGRTFFDKCQPVVIGPMTAKALRSYQVTDYLMAEDHTFEGMIQIIIADQDKG